MHVLRSVKNGKVPRARPMARARGKGKAPSRVHDSKLVVAGGAYVCVNVAGMLTHSPTSDLCACSISHLDFMSMKKREHITVAF